MNSFKAYSFVASPSAVDSLNEHYGDGAGMYMALSDYFTTWKAILLGWPRSNHPAQLHYGWDSRYVGVNESMRLSVRQTVARFGFESNEKRTVLEGGCGLGGSALQIAYDHPNWEVHGISLVPKQIDVANRIKAHRGLNNVRFKVANLLSTGFGDSMFDAIYSTEVLCHIPSHEKHLLFSELHRILKPGGNVVVMDGYLGAGLNSRWYEEMKRGWTLPDLVTPGQMSESAEGVGFRVSECSDVTDRIRHFSRIIYRKSCLWYPILYALRYLGFLLPIRKLNEYLGVSSGNAIPFAKACFAQKRLIETGEMVYFVHVFTR